MKLFITLLLVMLSMANDESIKSFQFNGQDIPISSQLIGQVTDLASQEGFCGFAENMPFVNNPVVVSSLQSDPVAAQAITEVISGNYYQRGHYVPGQTPADTKNTQTGFCQTRGSGINVMPEELGQLASRVVDLQATLSDERDNILIGDVKNICSSVLNSPKFKQQQQQLKEAQDGVQEIEDYYGDVLSPLRIESAKLTQDANTIATSIDPTNTKVNGKGRDEIAAEKAELNQRISSKERARQVALNSANEYLQNIQAYQSGINYKCLSYMDSVRDPVAELKMFLNSESNYYYDGSTKFMQWKIDGGEYQELKSPVHWKLLGFEKEIGPDAKEGEDTPNDPELVTPIWGCDWQAPYEKLNSLKGDAAIKCPEGYGWKTVKKFTSKIAESLHARQTSSSTSASTGGSFGLFSLGGSMSKSDASTKMDKSSESESDYVSFEYKIVKITSEWFHPEAFKGETIAKMDLGKETPVKGAYTYMPDCEEGKDAECKEINQRILDHVHVSHYPTQILLVRKFVLQSNRLEETIKESTKESSSSFRSSVGYGPFKGSVAHSQSDAQQDKDGKKSYSAFSITDPDVKIAGMWLSEYPQVPSAQIDATSRFTKAFRANLCGEFKSACQTYLSNNDEYCTELIEKCNEISEDTETE